MGVYIYRITPQKVKCSDGKMANVAIFAYKPTYSGFDSDKINSRMAFASGCVAAKRVKSTGRVVMGYDGRVDPLSKVYETTDKIFYDDDFGTLYKAIEGISVVIS